MNRHPFEHCGVAALSDLKSPEWRELFERFEANLKAFRAKEAEFRSPEYGWPRDPLHNWSRSWEYPYIYHHLKAWKPKTVASPRVVDVGSGVTFFPFAVARLGCRVTCTDLDPVCAKDLNRAALCIAHDPGSVDFRLTDGTTLPFADAEADAVYCISVLEHIPTFETTLAEIARTLKPGGLFLLTFDLDLRGDFELGVEALRRLTAAWESDFIRVYPERTVHPADILTSDSGPYAILPAQGFARARFEFRQLARMALGLKRRYPVPFRLAVQGAVLKRK